MKSVEDLREQFVENGYVVIPPNDILSEGDLYDLQLEFEGQIREYADGYVDPAVNDSHKDKRFSPQIAIEKASYHGCALRHRFRRGYGSADKLLDDNFLYGKRGVLPDRNFSEKMIKFIEKPSILEKVSAMLATTSDNLSFHNGSMTKVFPGCTGESGQLHMDTPGFVNDRRKLLNPSRFLVNVFVFVSDINEDLAPMRVIPESHRKYDEINRVLAKSFGGSSEKNNVPQAGQLFEELLTPLDLKNPVNLTGPAGTIVLMNSGLLHAATENKSSSETRRVIILNYSRKDHIEFRKKYYYSFPQECAKVFSLANNKELFQANIWQSDALFFF